MIEFILFWVLKRADAPTYLYIILILHTLLLYVPMLLDLVIFALKRAIKKQKEKNDIDLKDIGKDEEF
tara:strand:- start:4976 stop:5179 length:204 start_codon:yes stop_codon:yes gene_type:complete